MYDCDLVKEVMPDGIIFISIFELLYLGTVVGSQFQSQSYLLLLLQGEGVVSVSG